MANNKGKSSLLGIQGVVGHQTAPDYGFLYTNEGTKNPNYNIGDRVVLPDGRVFRYAKAGAALNPSKGAQNSVTFLDSDNTQAAAAIGDTEISITLNATSAGANYFGTADRMVGAYFSQPDTTHCTFRRIIKHPIGSTSDVIKITLDAPITRVIPANSFYEILPNPYGYLKQSQGTSVSVMGIPTVVVGSGNYCWVQTWGPLWVNVNSGGVGSGAYDRRVVFAEGGGLDQITTGATVIVRQVAGWIIDKTTSGTWDNPPFIMLTISP